MFTLLPNYERLGTESPRDWDDIWFTLSRNDVLSQQVSRPRGLEIRSSSCCCMSSFFLIYPSFLQSKSWFFPKDEEKAHLAEICPKICRRCEICRADVLKSEYDAHMKESLVLHMTFMMTRVVVRVVCFFVPFFGSLYFVCLSLFRIWRRSWRLSPKTTQS
jgi:hypothetical protein